ncbi:halocyanin domain-containing protein [Halorientalis salina]|uniref:halocyanin domain-containing protein n=1 Tax=Halorientalis salina TaxID=2932266 RepID=UPI0010AC6F92|nr:halocyanin domain-containing protein [Halorientalis salina]
MNRRDFLRTAGGAAGATAAVSASAGTAVAQEGNETSGNETSGGGGGSEPAGPPDFGGYLDGANNYNGEVADETGSDTVTVQVGAGDGLAFGPAAVHVDNGATVQWEWTGEGGAHNVVADDGSFESGSAVDTTGVEFEHTFEEDGIYNYYCQPHEASGMLGSVVVGTDYPTAAAEGGESGPNTDPTHMGVPFQAHWVGIATILMMFVSLIFTFFLLKYGESPHAKGGND